MSLPYFKYHPDPIQTGSVTSSDKVCAVCNLSRGYIYTGPVYVRGGFEKPICPWCISDGAAHNKFGLEFQDASMVGGGGQWDEVSLEVINEVTLRTPGFCGWQQEQWFTHCHDAAAFLGPVGYKELRTLDKTALKSFKQSLHLPEESWEKLFHDLDRDGSPTAYLFQCLHCGYFGGYTDCD